LEVCVDVPGQRWEPRVLMCVRDPGSVADLVSQEIAREPGLDARLGGCDRRTLRPDPTMDSELCNVAASPMPPAPATTPARRMTARGVGAAVVVDNDQPGPGIITERDIVRCWTSDGVTCELPSSQAKTG
jgi:hypothetical protein